ncbi:MAG: pdp [Firmicutes bacterium]|nr:pdp [Bacillota bacterium]
MRMVDVIAKKRDGLELTQKEIAALVEDYCREEIPDYQMAALLMAVYFRGMTDKETAALTMAMANSGQRVDLSSVSGIKVDKHSTGGVADTTTLVLAPLVAAAGVPVAKMSGRGLGFTGGTIDKLESIPGFKTMLTQEEFIANLNKWNIAVTGQTPNITPADGKMYALRDVTSTVDSIPLIASSIMSKKIAAGADKIVLDVKTGSGAFMKHLDDAVTLAQAMVRIGNLVNRETIAIITSMAEPLGVAVGNSLEVEEAIDILAGTGGSEDLRRVCLTIGSHMLMAAGQASSFQAGYETLEELLINGKGLSKFKELLAAQGGSPEVVTQRNLLPEAAFEIKVPAMQTGFVQAVDTALIGYSAMVLGAGREHKEQAIDLGAGLIMKCRIGDYVHQGDTVAILYTNQKEKLSQALTKVGEAVRIGQEEPVKPKLILGIVDSKGVHME